MQDWLNEHETRRQRIDPMLAKQGWDVADPSKVWAEVDTKQSDFRKQKYKTVDETLLNEFESKYADYLLLDASGDPLAIIEAKRTAKDPIIGQKQAEEYAADIKNQTGKDVFIFLSNGYDIWFWNKPFEAPRMIKGFHSRLSLERIQFQNENKQSLNNILPKNEIIDRDYQIEAVKRVTEGIERGKRKFLLVQATGTGKTRVAMGLIDLLLRAKRAQKILFLTDRKQLRKQAYDDFKEFFPHENKSLVFGAKLDKTSRLYASTIQTFMECYQEFSPGDFDVIISDEAHRSIYNKWKDVFTYFDAIQIGLTATPADMIERDTFRFFDCEKQTPTFSYSYEQAIEEKYLAPYRVYKASTHFQIQGIKPEDIPQKVREELESEGFVSDELNFEGTEIEKKVIVIGTNEAIVREFMDHCLLDNAGKPAKTIIFAVSKMHAKRIWESFQKLYPEHKGELARIIVSDDPRAQELITQFETEDMPRVAISVDMLDTGVDIPEVCNLVFAKPIFSSIKFWQMIGRGTRHEKICKHKEWLPDGRKDYFLIFDFWNNFEYFKMNPEGREVTQSESVIGRIFRARLDKFKLQFNLKDYKNAAKTQQLIVDTVKKLPLDSIAVREKLRDVEMAVSPKLWDNSAIDPTEFFRTKITPLMRYQKDVNLDIAYFTFKVEQLALAIIQKDSEKIEKIKVDIVENLNKLPLNLHAIKPKAELIEKFQSKSWKPVYSDTELLLAEIAPLMKFKRQNDYPKVILDIDDVVQQRKIIEYGEIENPKQEYVEVYRKKVEARIKDLADKNPTIRKIKNNEILNEADLQKLEEALYKPELFISEETLQKAYAQHKGTLVQFIKKILGMYEFPKPEELIEEEFKTFLIQNGQKFNADQINFIRTVKTQFLKKRRIDYSDFYEPPFTNIPKAPSPLFRDEFLKEVVDFCKGLEKVSN